ncbi:4Fe-4S binding protein [Desulfovibrio sp. OttesenSCG-928-A18]|nr:4Fe-4S binding protein [Desulfovibrio sp. OttesenSCG-928-A18]
MKTARTSARRLRIVIQGCSLALFIFLLLGAAWPLGEFLLPADLFLRLDPSAAALIPVAAREWLPRLWPGLLILGLSLVFGRVFCGYICPMGTSLDIGRAVGAFFAGKKSRPAGKSLSPAWSRVKYIILTVMFTAAFAGVNLLFWGSPIALITRFYALVLHPVLLLGAEFGLSAGRPLAAFFDWQSLSYMSVEARRFESIYFVAIFFAILFVLERVRPRFWCRYLCPAGALMGLLARRPFWRRKVADCAACGACARHCPGGAIHSDAADTMHSECLTCRRCVDVCPTGGTTFCFSGVMRTPQTRARDKEQAQAQGAARSPAGERARGAAGRTGAGERTRGEEGRTGAGTDRDEASSGLCPLPSRRAFVGAAALGLAAASLQYSGASSLLRPAQRGLIWAANLVRPPGALPEADFLDRCIRCGECMKVCPTNGLQPVWFSAGVEGMFSPVLVPRRGPCDPDCAACGLVCPTQALQALPLEEKRWAKVGTAVVEQKRCLAWAEDRSCLVCQEVCPYGSVKVVQMPEAKVPVPVVDALRCYGCGYCEQHCPVRVPAIVVEPLNAMRLKEKEYRRAGLEAGFFLEPRTDGHAHDYPAGQGGLPPGFSPPDAPSDPAQPPEQGGTAPEQNGAARPPAPPPGFDPL